MIIDGKIEIRKPNKRDKRLYLKEDNLLVSVPLQLDEFQTAFEGILISLIRKRKDIGNITFSDKELLDRHTVNFGAILQCLRVIDSISYTYMIQSIIHWPVKIKDEETRRNVFSLTTNKIANLRTRLHVWLWNISEAYFTIVNYPSLSKTYATELMEESFDTFNTAGLQKEMIEPLISSIWDIHKGLEKWAFPEPQFYQWNFSYDEGPKRYLELCKQNSTQRKSGLSSEHIRKFVFNNIQNL